MCSCRHDLQARGARQGPVGRFRRSASMRRRATDTPAEHGTARYDPCMDRIRIVDVTRATTFGLLPACADPAFDHRTCDYWEDRERGSRAHRAGWLQAAAGPGVPSGQGVSTPSQVPRNPFAPASAERPANPCLLYTSDAADEEDSVDLGGRRIITKK